VSVVFNYRAMHYSAKGGHAIACRLSVRPSVCNVDINCDDIDWNSSKMISRLVSLGCSLSADPNVTGLLQGEQPEIIARMGVGCGKKWLLAYRSSNISATRKDRTKITFGTNSPKRAFDRANINDLGWLWRVIMLSVCV